MGSFGAGSVPTKEGQRSAPKRGAGGSSGAGSVPTKEGQRSAPERWVVRVVGRDGVLGLPAREGWKVRWKRSASPKPSPLRGSAVGWLEFWALARCVGLRVGRCQSPKPSHSGTACN